MSVIQSRIKSGLIASILFHVILFLLFLHIDFQWAIETPQFIEIQFDGGSKVMSPAVPTGAVTIPKEYTLPVQRNIESLEQLINFAERDKYIPDEVIQVLPAGKPVEIAPRAESISDEKKEITNFAIDSKIIPEFETLSGLDGESPFTIEGLSANRTIINKVIPQYPESIQQEAVIKIRFSVLPNGLVGDIVPLIKSNDLLERITLEAFKQWRFNPLTPDQPQLPETGTITFRYILK